MMVVRIFFMFFMLYGSTAESDIKIICFGDTLKLQCGTGNKLEIFGAFYKVLQLNSTICGHINKDASPCHQPRLERLIRNDCQGKSECILGYRDKNVAAQTDCRPSMYLNVLYGCVIETKSSTNTPSDIFAPALVTNSDVQTTQATDIHDKYEESGLLRLSRVLMQFKVVYEYCVENNKKMTLCVILSIAAGILMFILFVILLLSCEKFTSKRKEDFDVEDGENDVEVSAPVVPPSVPANYETVLVTRQNGVPLSETTLSSDSTLTTRGKARRDHQVISTIRRSHSIDEGTQTDLDEVESVDIQPQSLSVEEAQELGYLVDVMKYYNRKLDDDFYPDTREKRKQIPRNRTPENQTFYYSSSPERKPLLAQQTSSSADGYSPVDDSSSDERTKFQLPNNKDNSRNPSSELSYTTSISNVSLDLYTPDSIYSGETLRYNSMQRTTPRTPRTPKPGVRGDGFSFISN